MSASGDPRADWFAPPVWDDLKRLESRHRQLQREHDLARRRLDQVTPDEADELRNAWREYCVVIAELDEATAALEHLRTGTG
ncbi:MAG: hypothetical protein KGO22_07755 [Gammaproteobacteria bacterium]|nr:hypothetical protein [Gammaproteobacteria bacterium]